MKKLTLLPLLALLIIFTLSCCRTLPISYHLPGDKHVSAEGVITSRKVKLKKGESFVVNVTGKALTDDYKSNCQNNQKFNLNIFLEIPKIINGGVVIVPLANLNNTFDFTGVSEDLVAKQNGNYVVTLKSFPTGCMNFHGRTIMYSHETIITIKHP